MKKKAMKKIRNLSKEEVEELIASGAAVRVHPYSYKNVLKPRGSMKKESLGEYILERLLTYYEDWTNEEYGDNPNQATLLQFLQDNLRDEVAEAWKEFLKRINVGS